MLMGLFHQILAGSLLFHQLDLARPPGLVEPRLGRTIEAQDGKPAFAGNGLDPVRLLAGRWFRAEVEIE